MGGFFMPFARSLFYWEDFNLGVAVSGNVTHAKRDYASPANYALALGH